MTTTPLPLSEYADAPGFFVLTLEPNQGPMVVLDHPLIQRLEAAIRAIPAAAQGLVLRSGSDRVFVAGADLKSIDTWPDDQLINYLAYGTRVFGLLCELNCPTVAAISGAALGGGLELAMHCDGLVAAPSPSGKPYPVGLPESGLSICPGWGGTNLLPARMDAADAITRTATGKNMTYDEAVAAGMFDRVAPSAEELIPAAVQWIKDRRAKGHTRRDGDPSRWIGRPDAKAVVLAGLLAARSALPATESAAAVVRAIEVGLEEGWQAAVMLERRELVRLRSTAAGKAALKAFFEKSVKK
ncbi:MAG: enoyl-CoA hydratase/isomerase family protein [Pyrinomonadaceae bacterium]|nr:enoyl-CoA hydratase/isomerase family protein [Phycisphaerales bacterium]